MSQNHFPTYGAGSTHENDTPEMQAEWESLMSKPREWWVIPAFDECHETQPTGEYSEHAIHVIELTPEVKKAIELYSDMLQYVKDMEDVEECQLGQQILERARK